MKQTIILKSLGDLSADAIEINGGAKGESQAAGSSSNDEAQEQALAIPVAPIAESSSYHHWGINE